MVFQFQLSKKHLDFQKAVNDELVALKGSKDLVILEKLASSGYLALPWLDGAKADDYLSVVLAVEEVAKLYPKVANSMVELLFAQELTKNCQVEGKSCECASKISRLEKKVTVLFTEPANSEMDMISTSFEKVDGGYKVTGKKLFAPENYDSDNVLIVGKLSDKSFAVAGISLTDIEVETKEVSFGVNTISTTLATIDSVVPSDKVILNAGQNLKTAINLWRVLIAASATGLAYMNISSSLSVVKTVKNSENVAMSNSQAVQFTLADIYGEIEGARLVTYYATAMVDSGKSPTRFATIAKVQATEAAVLSGTQSPSLMGCVGNFYNQEYLEALQLTFNRQIKDGGARNAYNTIYEEALARR